jgi:hypothetical protein
MTTLTLDKEKDQADYFAAVMKANLRTYNERQFAAVAANWDFGATCVVTIVGPWYRVVMDAYNGANPVPPDMKFRYEGNGGGTPFLGGGATWGRFWSLVERNKLPGASGFSIELTPAHISVQYFREGIGLIGHYVGGGLGFMAGAGGGTGNFTI